MIYIKLFIILSILLLQSTYPSLCDPIRSPTQDRIWREVINEDEFTWTANNFWGFFYDLDNNAGAESLTVHVNKFDNNIQLDSIKYSIDADDFMFKFDDWGKYQVVGFMGEKFFAGYSHESELFNQDIDLFSKGKITKILRDEKRDISLSTGSVLRLEDGYQINFRSVGQGEDILIDLMKNGDPIDTKILTINGVKESTYIFERYIEGQMIPIILLHISKPLNCDELSSVTFDGIFQISEEFISIEDYARYWDFNLRKRGNKFEMEKENSLKIGRGDTVWINDVLGFKVANSYELRFEPLLIKNDINKIRGVVMDLSESNEFTLTPYNFAGFYYDIDKDLGTERLDLVLSEGNKLLEPQGILYTTSAYSTNFEFIEWGYYYVMGFMGKKFFAGYKHDPTFNNNEEIIFKKSDTKNTLSYEQLEEILLDDNTEMSVTSGMPLTLAQDYELAIRSIDIDGNKVYLELVKDGQTIDSKVISPSRENPNMDDKTYYYKKNVGRSEGLVIIAVHFKNAFRGADQNIATIDGIWQISENPTDIGINDNYNKMRISSIDFINMRITMDNKDNTVSLQRDRDISLMDDFNIKTSDSEEIECYIYKN